MSYYAAFSYVFNNANENVGRCKITTEPANEIPAMFWYESWGWRETGNNWSVYNFFWKLIQVVTNLENSHTRHTRHLVLKNGWSLVFKNLIYLLAWKIQNQHFFRFFLNYDSTPDSSEFTTALRLVISPIVVRIIRVVTVIISIWRIPTIITLKDVSFW